MGTGRVVSSAEWRLFQTPDVYFTHRYYATSAQVESDVSDVVLLEWLDKEGKVYLPLILREIPGTSYLDAISAYGYGGPWIEGRPDLQSFRHFLDEWADGSDVVATFLRFHPLIRNAEAFKSTWPLRLIGSTAIWDLEKSDSLVEGMAKNHRKNWRRAVRSGVEARVTRKPNDVDEFRALYERTMARLSAEDAYWLGDAYWSSLTSSLGDDSLLVEALYEGRVVAAAWCLISENYLHFHLSGTSDEGRRVGGAYICRVAAAEWARDAGLRTAHHGGGVGGSNSSLLDWKMKFDQSVPLAQFYVAEITHNERAFNMLAESVPETNFFPPWRNSAAISLSRG